MLNLAL